MDEAYNGYPIHRWLAMGHLAEAESEIRTLNPELAKTVRKIRSAIRGNKDLDPKKDPDIMKILYDGDLLWADVNGTMNDGVTNTCSYRFWTSDADSDAGLSPAERRPPVEARQQQPELPMSAKPPEFVNW